MNEESGDLREHDLFASLALLIPVPRAAELHRALAPQNWR